MVEPASSASSSPLDLTLDATLRDPDKRSQLNPMQIADAFQKLRQGGWPDTRIMKEYSFSGPNFHQYEKFIKLPPQVQEALKRNLLNTSQARALSSLLEGHAALIPEAADRMMKEGMNHRAADAFVKSLLRDPASSQAVARPVSAAVTVPAPPQNGNGTETSAAEEDDDEEEDERPAPVRARDVRTGDYRARQGAPSDEQGHLIRRSIVLATSFLFFRTGQKKLKALGRLIDDWLDTFKRWFWNRPVRAAFIALWCIFAGYGVTQFYYRWKPHWKFIREHFWEVVTNSKALITLPQPLAVTSRLIDGHRLELTWPPAGPGADYRVYWKNDSQKDQRQVGDDFVTPAVRVGISKIWGKGYVGVVAIDAQHGETPLSELIPFAPEAVNESDEVTPFDPALEAGGNGGIPNRQGSQNGGKPGAAGKGSPITGGRSLPSGHSSPSGNPASPAASAVPIPTDVHYELKTPDLIILRWRAVGPRVTYNVYSSAASDLAHLRKENDQPVHLNVVTWTPETGLERYWIVVTAVDSQNHESNYSEAIEVVRHPEASGPGAVDKASDVIKKVLPW